MEAAGRVDSGMIGQGYSFPQSPIRMAMAARTLMLFPSKSYTDCISDGTILALELVSSQASRFKHS